METPEEAARSVFHPPLDDPDRPDPSCRTDWYAYALRHAERFIRARDEEVRADERGRCSVIHATLDDEALVAELVRRGVLEVDEYAEPCGWRCDVVTYDYDECRNVCSRSGPHAEHECVDGHTVAVDPDDAQPESTRRYVTAWEPDTRTPQQRSDDAVDELRRRLKGDA